MDLSNALSIAAKQADAKGGAAGWHACRFDSGSLVASDGVRGVRCPIETTVKVAVDAAKAKAIIGALTGPTLTVKRNSLHAKAGRSNFKLKGLPASALMALPDEPPATAWTRIDGDKAAAIAVVAELAGKEDMGRYALSGIRFTPDWVAACCSGALAVAWVPNLVSAAITAPATIFQGLSGDVSFAVADRRIWVREEDTGQIRWSLLLEAEWPDGSVNANLASAREGDNRHKAALDYPALAALAGMALVASDSPADAHRVTFDGGKLDWTYEGKVGRYQGDMDFDYTPEASWVIGINATLLGVALKGLISVSEEGKRYVSVGGPREALLLWGGEPIVEMLVLPMVLP